MRRLGRSTRRPGRRGALFQKLGQRSTVVKISIWTAGLTEGVCLTDVSRSVLCLDAHIRLCQLASSWLSLLDVRDIAFGAREDEEVVESSLTCWANLLTAVVLISQ